jgi:hypothetical protein
MNIQEQIQKDVAWVAQSSSMQAQLLHFLKSLKSNHSLQGNAAGSFHMQVLSTTQQRKR